MFSHVNQQGKMIAQPDGICQIKIKKRSALKMIPQYDALPGFALKMVLLPPADELTR